MKKLITLAIICLMAIPAFGNVDVTKKKKVQKPRHARKVVAVHPVKRSGIQPRSKGTGDMSQLANQDLQDKQQKTQQTISTLSNIEKQQSDASQKVIHNMK